MATPNEKTTVPNAPIVDPFPKPNTIPTGWDVSGLTSEPRPGSAQQVEKPAQNKYP
jgi:hypothetical protein